MAVVSVYAYSVAGSIDGDMHRTWTVTYKAETNSKLDDAIVVIKGSGIPLFADAYTFGPSQDLGATRQSLSCDYWDRDSSALLWRVTAVYSSRPLKGIQGRHGVPESTDPINVDDPSTWPAKLSGSFVHVIEKVKQDEFGNSVVNSAGDRFPDAVKRVGHRTLNIEKTYATFNVTNVDDAINKINGTTFFGKGPGFWKLMEAPHEEVYYGTRKFYDVRYTFELNPDTWAFQPENIGPRYKDASGNLVRFTDDYGFDLGGLGPLNTDGTKRAFGADPQILVFDPGFALDGSVNFPLLLDIPSDY